MKLVIPGQPLAKARAKAMQKGSKRWKYDPQENEKISMKWKLKSEMRQLKIECNVNPLYIHLHFYLRPCTSDLTRNLKLHGLEEHTKKKDLDNLEKFILDCANGILYKDDSQIIRITSSKEWAENPRTEIQIMQKETMNIDDIEKKIINLFSPTEFAELFNDAKILFILAESSRNSQSLSKEDWLKQSANCLTQFARKYGDKLHKINRFSKSKFLTDIIQEEHAANGDLY